MLNEHASRINAACQSGDAAAEGAATKLNDTLKRLSRLLLPICGTVKGTYGHDPYAYTPQTTMLPALFEIPAYARLPEGEARWMLQTKLTREVNRLHDALDDACALATGTIADLTGSRPATIGIEPQADTRTRQSHSPSPSSKP